MRLRPLLALALALLALPLSAQTVTVTGTKVVNVAGAPATGAITVRPTNNAGAPVSFTVGGGGTGLAATVSVLVTNGAFSVQLPDVLLTNPKNICFKFSFTDPTSYTEDLPGAACVQPSTQPNSPAVRAGWCAVGGGCNFDLFVGNQQPGVAVTSGPSGVQGRQGANGSDGCLLGSNCSTIDFNHIAGVPAAKGDGVTDDSAAVLAACTANSDLWLTATYAIAQNATLGCALHFIDQGELVVASGKTVTLNGKVFSTAKQIFAGLGAIVFGPANHDAPVEWFGAIGDGVTDNAIALQKGVNALSGGNLILEPFIYRTSGTLVINKANIYLHGTTSGVGSLGGSPTATLRSSSASADIVDVVGANPGAPVFWGGVDHVALDRTVTPTGTAAGISESFACGFRVENVESADSVRDFYLHYAPSCGTGGLIHANAAWGYNGVSYTAGSLYGFYLDSADGNAENSLYLRDAGVDGSRLGIPTSTSPALLRYGLAAIGTAINDIDVDTFGVAGADFGVLLNFTGASPASLGNTNAYDLHFHNLTVDESYNTGVLIQNVPTSQLGDISFEDGWVYSQTPTAQKDFDIENSSGVTIHGMMIGGAKPYNIYAANSQQLLIANNQLKYNFSGNGIQFNGTVDSLIQGNQLDGASVSQVLVAMTGGSVANVVTGNVFTGTANHGYYADGTSGANVVGTNLYNSAHIGVLETGNSNGACRFIGTPTVAFGTAAGSSPGLAAGTTIYLTSPANNCAFTVQFVAGTAPAAGSAGSPTNILAGHFTDINGNAIAWSSNPACFANPLTPPAAAIPTFVQSNPGLVALDIAPAAVLTAGTTYAWTVKCSLE